MQPEIDVDYVSACVDEIALEGLDGITLSAFWQRLEKRPHFPIRIDNQSKSFLWQIVATHPEIEIFELPKPRSPLFIFNRYDHFDVDTGIITEPTEVPLDIYPIQFVKGDNEYGSCATYYQRNRITELIRKDGLLCWDLEEALNKWGDTLVLVASQKQRLISLVGPECDPTVEFTDLQYMMLERIGRSRYHGEITQGSISLMVLNEPPKNLHYQRKLLLAKKLITKQIHYQRNLNGQTSSGKLLHLQRFYVEKEPKFVLLMKKMCEILSKKPNRQAPLLTLRAELGMKERSFKKLFHKNNLDIATTLITCPLREINPELPEDQYSYSNGKEKTLRCLRLRDDFDISSLEKTEDDEENECANAEDMISNGPKILCMDQTLLSRTLEIIEGMGPDGAALTEIGWHLGLPKLEVRLLCRNLERLEIVSTIMKDAGRQRTTRYFSRRFEDQSHLHKELMHEMRKVLQLATDEEIKPVSSSQEGVDAETDVQKIGSEAKKTIEHGKFKEKGVDVKQVKENSVFTRIIEELSNGDPKKSHITPRMLRRIHMILKAIREEKFFDNIFKLQKLIMTEESKEGYGKIDKKSVMRLVETLAKAGAVRSFKPVLCYGNHVEKFHFVCSPEIKENDPIVLSAINRAKYKYFAFNLNDVPKNSVLKDNTGKYSGLEPKFIRMKVIHQFLYYLVYDYTGVMASDYEFQLWENKWSSTESGKLGDPSTLSETPGCNDRTPKMYNDDKTWRMFIPPLSQHTGWPIGWCLLSDALMRLPLSIFVKVVNCSSKAIEGLEHYLKDPVKQHYLLFHLPENIRNSLFCRPARRDVASVIRTAQYLAYIGLLSFGPHTNKIKDQRFIYLNNKATLLDTTSSKPSYFQISMDQDYPKMNYNFENRNVVEQYWFDMSQICLHTPLGSYSSCQGQSIVMEKLELKPAMIKTLQSLNPEEIVDEGIIPGDGLGAAGFDSAMFSHLKRNWQFFSNTSDKSSDGNSKRLKRKFSSQTAPQPSEGVVYLKYLQENPIQSQIKKGSQKRLNNLRKTKNIENLPPSAKTSDMIGNEQIQKSLQPNVPNAVRMRGQKRKRTSDANNEDKKEKKKKKMDKIVRTIQRRNNSKKRRPFYDEIDLKALKLQSKLRVSWTPQEDSFLLLCKVASILIHPNYYHCMVVSSLCVRNLLHEFFPGSKDKTSRACHRRILFMLKNNQTVNSVAVFVGEAKQDESIMEAILPNLPPKKDEALREEIFRKVLISLMQKFTTFTPLSKDYLPKTKEELQARYSVVGTDVLIGQSNSKFDVKNIVDIHLSVVHSLILSSLACTGDKADWSYQLYRICQQYPDNLLRSVFTRLCNDKLISRRKGVKKRSLRILPLSTSPYQLSIKFNHKFLSRYQPHIFPEAFSIKSRLLATFTEAYNTGYQDKGVEILINQESGYVAAILTLIAKQQLNLEMHIPEQILLFDADSFNKKSGQQKKMKKISKGEDQDLDNEDNKSSTDYFSDNDKSSSGCHTSNKNSSKYSEDKEINSDHNMEIEENSSNAVCSELQEFETNHIQKIQDETTTISQLIEEERNKEIESNTVISLSNESQDTDENYINNNEQQLKIFTATSSTVIIPYDTLQEKLKTVSSNEAKNHENITTSSRASRVALWMIRQQLTQSPAERSQHAQDYIAVNPCKVIARLQQDEGERHVHITRSPNPNNAVDTVPILDHDYYRLCSVDSEGNSFQSSLTKTETKHHKEIINSLAQFYHEVGPNFEETLKTAEALCYTKEDLSDLEIIYNFILQQHEMGATTRNLKDQFPSLKGARNLLDHLKILRESKVVIRVGVNIIRYVSFVHCKPWILNSVHVPKDQKMLAHALVNQELVKKNKKSKTEHPIHDQTEKGEDLNVNKNDNTEEHMFSRETEQENMTSITISSTENPKNNGHNLDNSNIPSSSSNFDEIGLKWFNSNTDPNSSSHRRKHSHSSQHPSKEHSSWNWEKIRFLCRPWRKPDGRLNRPVLRIFLSSILAIIMKAPGINFHKVVDKFLPALQPVHVYELIEILMSVKCIKLLQISCQPVSPFSVNETGKIVDAVDFDPFDEELLIEAEEDCVLSFGNFIAHL